MRLSNKIRLRHLDLNEGEGIIFNIMLVVLCAIIMLLVLYALGILSWSIIAPFAYFLGAVNIVVLFNRSPEWLVRFWNRYIAQSNHIGDNNEG